MAQILNWMSLPALAVLVGIFVWRKHRREFPLFFWYLIVNELATVARFFAQRGSPTTYFYVYWISDLLTTIFNFLAVYELFARRLFPRFHKVRVYRYLFPLMASGVLVGAWFTALEAPNKLAALLIEARVLSFILVAILAFFVVLMLAMGRYWTRYDFGIAFGFALYNAAFLITSAAWVRSHYHAVSFQELPLIAFDVSCLVWLFAFLQPEKQPVLYPADAMDPQMLHEARNWENVLKDWLNQEKR